MITIETADEFFLGEDDSTVWQMLNPRGVREAIERIKQDPHPLKPTFRETPNEFLARGLLIELNRLGIWRDEEDNQSFHVWRAARVVKKSLELGEALGRMVWRLTSAVVEFAAGVLDALVMNAARLAVMAVEGLIEGAIVVLGPEVAIGAAVAGAGIAAYWAYKKYTGPSYEGTTSAPGYESEQPAYNTQSIGQDHVTAQANVSGATLPPEVAQKIVADAIRYGLDPASMMAEAWIESKGRNIGGYTSSAAGIYQFMPSTWERFGEGKSVMDVDANIDAGMRFTIANITALKGAGLPVTPGMIYLAHQQGVGGLKEIYAAAQEGKRVDQLSPTIYKNVYGNLGGHQTYVADYMATNINLINSLRSKFAPLVAQSSNQQIGTASPSMSAEKPMKQKSSAASSSASASPMSIPTEQIPTQPVRLPGSKIIAYHY